MEIKKAGSNPQIWGPFFWRYLHRIAYRSDHGMSPGHAKQIFFHLSYLLPCKSCRDSFYRHIYDDCDGFIDAADKQCLLEWSLKFHNQVNQDLGQGDLDIDVLRRRCDIYESSPITPDCVTVLFIVALHLRKNQNFEAKTAFYQLCLAIVREMKIESVVRWDWNLRPFAMVYQCLYLKLEIATPPVSQILLEIHFEHALY